MKTLVPEEYPWDLLLLADPSREQIEKYIHQCRVLALLERDVIIGVVVLAFQDAGSSEIMNVAVAETHRGKGLGKLLISGAIDQAKNEGCTRILVGTGNSGINQMALYQKMGFRIDSVDRDFFTRNYSEQIIENGIICQDMVRLSRSI